MSIKGFAEISNGKLLLDKNLENLIKEIKHMKGEVVFIEYDKPHHWLYKYYWGFLLEDIMSHIGDPEKQNLHWFFKTKFLSVELKSIDDLPVKHRKTARIIRRTREAVDYSTGQVIDTTEYYQVTFSTGSITGREFREYIKKVEEFFMDFLGGHMSKRTDEEGMQYRDKGFKEDE